jgi:hypothetical protein
MSRSAHFTVVGCGMEGVLLEVEGDAQQLGEVVGEVLVGGPQVSMPPVQFSRTVPANCPHCPPPPPPGTVFTNCTDQLPAFSPPPPLQYSFHKLYWHFPLPRYSTTEMSRRRRADRRLR